MMTFERLADMVAADFRETMEQEGFETFEEMKRCYCWEPQDIKDEVQAIITELSERLWQTEGEFWMADDCSFIQIGLLQEMVWRDFRMLVFASLKSNKEANA